MKFNEYELVVTQNKLNIKVIKAFNEEINSIQNALLFILDLYNISNLAIEKSFVLSYDANGKINGFMQIGIGDSKGVQFLLSTSFKFLLLKNAFGCIFIHNHIKGCKLEPSADDYHFHQLANLICDTLNITMYGNYILQDWQYYYDIKTDTKEEFVL